MNDPIEPVKSHVSSIRMLVKGQIHIKHDIQYQVSIPFEEKMTRKWVEREALEIVEREVDEAVKAANDISGKA